MESHSSTKSVATQTCCHTCRQPVPISKSMSAPDLDTDSPPQYSALENKVKVSQTTSDPRWEFSPSNRKGLKNYWTRTIQRGNETWTQYGISQHSTVSKPDFFFTCKNQLREGKNEKDLRECCVIIASAMRMHRGLEYSRCACEFGTWRQRGGSGGCEVRWYRMDSRMFRYFVDRAMRWHDYWCACGCFDVEAREEAPAAAFSQDVERRDNPDSKALGTEVLRG